MRPGRHRASKPLAALSVASGAIAYGRPVIIEEDTGATGLGEAAEQDGPVAARAGRRTGAGAHALTLLVVTASDDVKQLLLDRWSD